MTLLAKFRNESCRQMLLFCCQYLINSISFFHLNVSFGHFLFSAIFCVDLQCVNVSQSPCGERLIDTYLVQSELVRATVRQIEIDLVITLFVN